MLPMRTVPLQGRQVHYLAAGSGAPVLLLHGLSGGCRTWEQTVSDLAPLARVVAPDLPGWGESPPPDGFSFRMPALVAWLEQFMEAVGMPAATVAGWSFGGAAALHLALTAPHRVQRLCLVGAAGLSPAAHWTFRLMNLPGLGEWLLRPTRGHIRAVVRELAHDPATVDETFFNYLMHLVTRPWHTRTTLQWVRRNRVLWRGARGLDVRPRLAELHCPALLLWGRQDTIVPLRQAEAALPLFPAGRLHVWDGCGHLPPVEKRTEFSRVAAEFVSGEVLARV